MAAVTAGGCGNATQMPRAGQFSACGFFSMHLGDASRHLPAGMSRVNNTENIQISVKKACIPFSGEGILGKKNVIKRESRLCFLRKKAGMAQRGNGDPQFLGFKIQNRSREE